MENVMFSKWLRYVGGEHEWYNDMERVRRRHSRAHVSRFLCVNRVISLTQAVHRGYLSGT